MKRSFKQFFEQLQGKAHVYPPVELYDPLKFSFVSDKWREYSLSESKAPFGIYIHLPFCMKKCSFCYCDTIISGKTEEWDAYIQALLNEMTHLSPALHGRKVDTIYFGGGTPTYVGANRFRHILESLHARFEITDSTHLNVEGTPASIDEETAAVLGEFNTDRVTLGIQSLDEKILSEMNRPQSFDEIKEAVALLRKNKVSHINFDLVGGLSNDTAAGFSRHFKELLKLEPEMVHVYPYTPRQAFPASPEKEKILRIAREMVESHGYRSIKNDGWGKSDASANIQVKHKIEKAGSCLGLGNRSRSHIFGRLAYMPPSYRDYLKSGQEGKPPTYHGFALKLRHQVERFLIDNLRQGVSKAQFTELFGGNLQNYLQKRCPEILSILEDKNGEIRASKDVGSDREIQRHIYDHTLKKRLFLRHIGQSKGWPVEKMDPKKLDQETDWNWLHFLTKKLTKGNTYPPISKTRKVTETEVRRSWENYSLARKKGKAAKTAGIYCHIPFCATKCKFCYCYSIQLKDRDKMRQYVKAVQRQVERISDSAKDIRFNTLYFGGGTPSLLPPEDLDILLETIHAHFKFTDDFQFNFEGTPQTLGREGRIPILAKHGVTRLTIGIQSLEKRLLKKMDRVQQSSIGVGSVISEARANGIKTINVDVLAGLPGQSLEEFQSTFDELLKWRPEVIHPYPYQNTEETRFYQEGFRTNDTVARLRKKMMEYAEKRLREENYLEIPNESWCLGIEHRNQQDVDKIKHSSSVMPLGYVARGHIFGQLTYGTLADEFQNLMVNPDNVDVYYGDTITRTQEQIRYIISNLRTGFSRVDFEEIFGEDCLENFWLQFSILQKMGKINVDALTVESKMESSYDSILYAKLFFEEEYHELLRQEYQDEYEPATDYIRELEKLYEKTF